jgi:hypothetical protein
VSFRLIGHPFRLYSYYPIPDTKYQSSVDRSAYHPPLKERITKVFAAAMAANFFVIGIVVLVALIIHVIAMWRIPSEAGDHVIILLVFAYTGWPIEARLRALPPALS